LLHRDIPARYTAAMRYIPALDGLRGVAVLSVIALHAGFPWARYGFLGVDLFFVLSGFLITTLLLREWQCTGAINLRAFYVRRAARLFPALGALLVAVALWSLTFASDGLADRNWVGILSSLLYAANWTVALGIREHIGLLQHTWSLAIEEQFYLLWPFVLVALLRRGWSWKRLLWLTLGGALLSAVWRVILWRLTLEPWRGYAGTDTRADGLLLGCALALLLLNVPAISSRRIGYVLLPVVGLAVLGCVAISWFGVTLRDFWWYSRGGYAVAALLSAALVLLAATGSVPLFRRVLSVAPLVWIGRISYGLYLWHYPILNSLERSTRTLDTWERLGLIALTVGVALLSWVAVERPVQQWARRRLIHSTVASVQYTSPQRVHALRPNEYVTEPTTTVPSTSVIPS
jgi:peptidoglycan/LPS O-acetylase OafA/YrhL